MTRSVAELFEEVFELDERERATLAGLLLESIEQDPYPEIEEAWKIEIERRIQEIDSGAVDLIPWEDVKTRLFQTASSSEGACGIRDFRSSGVPVFRYTPYGIYACTEGSAESIRASLDIRRNAESRPR